MQSQNARMMAFRVKLGEELKELKKKEVLNKREN